MAQEKTPLEAVVAKKAEAFNLDKEELMEAVRTELTSLLARDIAKQVVEGQVEKPKGRHTWGH